MLQHTKRKRVCILSFCFLFFFVFFLLCGIILHGMFMFAAALILSLITFQMILLTLL